MSLKEVTDGVEVEFITETSQAFEVLDNRLPAGQRSRTFKLSKDFASMRFDGSGRRLFEAPEWYFSGIGLRL